MMEDNFILFATIIICCSFTVLLYVCLGIIYTIIDKVIDTVFKIKSYLGRNRMR